MPFKKGNNYGKGRLPGTKNTFTEKLNKRIDFVLNVCLDTFEQDVKSMKPSERAKIVTELIEYRIPKLARLDGQINHIQTRVIQIVKPKDLEDISHSQSNLISNE